MSLRSEKNTILSVVEKVFVWYTIRIVRMSKNVCQKINKIRKEGDSLHIIKDENGNLCSHAHAHDHAHTHTYEHSHEHTHEHGQEDVHTHTHGDGDASCGGHCHSGESGHCHGDEGHCHGHSGHCHDHEAAPAGKSAALLKYMLDHNTHHAAELDQMAEKLAGDGQKEAAEQIRKAVDEFQKGNMYLGLALSLVKES